MKCEVVPLQLLVLNNRIFLNTSSPATTSYCRKVVERTLPQLIISAGSCFFFPGHLLLLRDHLKFVVTFKSVLQFTSDEVMSTLRGIYLIVTTWYSANVQIQVYIITKLVETPSLYFLMLTSRLSFPNYQSFIFSFLRLGKCRFNEQG